MTIVHKMNADHVPSVQGRLTRLAAGGEVVRRGASGRLSRKETGRLVYGRAPPPRPCRESTVVSLEVRGGRAPGLCRREHR